MTAPSDRRARRRLRVAMLVQSCGGSPAPQGGAAEGGLRNEISRIVCASTSAPRDDDIVVCSGAARSRRPCNDPVAGFLIWNFPETDMSNRVPPKRGPAPPPPPPPYRPLVPNPAPAVWQPIVAVQERYVLDAGIFEQINQGNILLANLIASL